MARAMSTCACAGYSCHSPGATWYVHRSRVGSWARYRSPAWLGRRPPPPFSGAGGPPTLHPRPRPPPRPCGRLGWTCGQSRPAMGRHERHDVHVLGRDRLLQQRRAVAHPPELGVGVLRRGRRQGGHPPRGRGAPNSNDHPPPLPPGRDPPAPPHRLMDGPKSTGEPHTGRRLSTTAQYTTEAPQKEWSNWGRGNGAGSTGGRTLTEGIHWGGPSDTSKPGISATCEWGVGVH